MGKGIPNQMNSKHTISVCIGGKKDCVGTEQRGEYEERREDKG